MRRTKESKYNHVITEEEYLENIEKAKKLFKKEDYKGKIINYN